MTQEDTTTVSSNHSELGHMVGSEIVHMTDVILCDRSGGPNGDITTVGIEGSMPNKKEIVPSLKELGQMIKAVSHNA